MMFFKKIVSLLLFMSLSVGYLPANNTLTDTQLHAVLGIITGFILSDVDSDGDGVLDSQDAFPHDATETVDTDGDGIGNNADTDDDGDGALDVDEVAAGTDPLDPDDLIFGGYKYKVVTSPYTGYKWLDRNLGASQVCTSFDDAGCYGAYYQWGRDADGHEKSTSGTTSTQSTSLIPGHGNFITSNTDWTSTDLLRANSWSQRDGTHLCPVGFRVPTIVELKTETLDNGVTNKDEAFSNYLKLPSAGLRSKNSGYMYNVGVKGYVWSSSQDYPPRAKNILFEDTDSKIVSIYRSSGVSVRCMKPVVTTDMPPVVTLHTDAQIEMIQFGAFPYIKVTAVDDVDGIIVPIGEVSDSHGPTGGPIGSSIVGVYTISYTATDSAGQVSNTVTVTLTIHPAMKKTGQTKIYDEDGAEHTHAEADSNASLRDDGYYQKGHVPLYVRDDGDEIVTDRFTGLQWQDDVAAKMEQRRWLTSAYYDMCTGNNGTVQDTSKCIDTSGDTATTYCTNLTLGGYDDWRLPSIEDLISITDKSKINPAIDTTFLNKVSGSYWSSTPHANVNREGSAWYVYFGNAKESWNDKSVSHYVRCVRGGQ